MMKKENSNTVVPLKLTPFWPRGMTVLIFNATFT